MSNVTPDVTLERHERSVVMTLTYDSVIAAKHASDAMVGSLATGGHGVLVSKPGPAKAALSRRAKIFTVAWCAANLAAAFSFAFSSTNVVGLLLAIVLLAVDAFMLFAAVSGFQVE